MIALWPHIEQSIQDASGSQFIIDHQGSISGGSINRVYRIYSGKQSESGKQSLLVKINTSNQLNMFEAEAAGLKELADVGAIRVPQVLCSAQAAGQAWLVMEYIEFSAADAQSSALLVSVKARG